MDNKLAGFPVNKILVAVDGSENSNKAVALGVEIARKWKPKVYIINVTEDNIPEGFARFAHDEHVSVSEYYKRACSQIVADAAGAFIRSGIKKIVTTCPSGDPAEEIIKAAEDNDVDLILMGIMGRGGFSRKVMGSVSSKVCNHVKSTCITVK